jgi:hypothetical protein
MPGAPIARRPNRVIGRASTPAFAVPAASGAGEESDRRVAAAVRLKGEHGTAVSSNLLASIQFGEVLTQGVREPAVQGPVRSTAAG